GFYRTPARLGERGLLLCCRQYCLSLSAYTCQLLLVIVSNFNFVTIRQS
ncbi:MAG: hypothetical protein ACI8WB_000925, partial [Phenylobacterium sp.]